RGSARARSSRCRAAPRRGTPGEPDRRRSRSSAFARRAPVRQPRRSPAAGTSGRARSRFDSSRLGSGSVRAPAAEAVKVTPELLMELRRPTDLAVSHDGTRLAYVVTPSFREKGKALESRLWLDGEPVTDPGAADALPRFAPDGTLAYASDRGHAGRMSLRIHERGEVGEIPGSVEDIRGAPDSSTLLVLAADLGSDRAGAQSATKIKEAGAGEEDPKVFRPAQHWRRLYRVDAATGATAEVGPPGINVFELGWAGGKVAAVCTE